MSTGRLNILKATRVGRAGARETLTFDTGVNVIVGEPNTGKTRWLEIIDFILGDDGKAEDKLGEIIFEKYVAAELVLQLGDETVTAQRRWHEAGTKTKIFVDDMPCDIPEFRRLLLDRLGIPLVHYPQGNPLGTRTWPELGFRSLFRHLYRRQRFWSDLADQQPTSEQHASILQFVGIAEVLYSREYGELIEKQKEIAELESRREHFIGILNEVSQELVSEEELGVAVTPDALSQATTRLREEATELNRRRAELLTAAVETASTSQISIAPDAISRMTEEFSRIKADEARRGAELERIRGRVAELELFQDTVSAEIGRLERARKAGDLLAGLKVTHCPACDQAVKRRAACPDDECYLCHQPTGSNGGQVQESAKRLDFELEQLQGELKETAELIDSLSQKSREQDHAIRELRSRAAQLTEQLRPVRIATAAIIPPDVAIIDNEIGRLVERMDQLRRIRESLSRRERISENIRQIRRRVEVLQAEVSKQTLNLDFDAASDRLSDGMNEYVALLKFDGKRMWTQKEIQFNLKRDGFSARVGRQRWSSQLGGTMAIYFLLAYHYSLLKLSIEEGSRAPGFLMLDFPAEIEGEKVADHENFVIEPFISLCATEGYSDVQLVAAGSAFKGLQGARRQEFTEVWK